MILVIILKSHLGLSQVRKLGITKCNFFKYLIKKISESIFLLLLKFTLKLASKKHPLISAFISPSNET